MNYNFDTPINRRNTYSLKWDVEENVLPMWVADMDFQISNEIKKAILDRAENGVFGYNIIPDEWYKAYILWWEKRHNFLLEKDWLIFCTGVVPAISSIVRKLTTPAEKVLVQTPTYNIFFNSIQNNGRQVLENNLKYDGNNYYVDFEDLEDKLKDPQTTLMILCNPHNPIGKIWDKETLAKIGTLAKKYNVTVISDEIHCDLTDIGYKYTPFASVSQECRDNSITCIAPTKAFNIAGLQTAAVSIPNPVLRHKVWRGLNTDEVAEPNTFAVDATIAAYTKGEIWLDSLREYIQKNKEFTTEYIRDNIKNIKVVPSKATYLLWLDCTKIAGEVSELNIFIKEKTGLYLSEGSQFGGNGKHFLRMNIACPRSILKDGLERLKNGLAEYEKIVLKKSKK